MSRRWNNHVMTNSGRCFLPFGAILIFAGNNWKNGMVGWTWRTRTLKALLDTIKATTNAIPTSFTQKSAHVLEFRACDARSRGD
jgi:hypothetical protein